MVLFMRMMCRLLNFTLLSVRLIHGRMGLKVNIGNVSLVICICIVGMNMNYTLTLELSCLWDGS